MRLISIRDPESGEEKSVGYVHGGPEGPLRFNGEVVQMNLIAAGAPLPDPDGEHLCLIADRVPEIGPENFIAFGEGECLLGRIGPEDWGVVVPGFLGVSKRIDLWRPIRTGVLTISDKGSRGERVDTAGPLLGDLAAAQGCRVRNTAVVPDDRESIAEILRDWSDREGLDLILSTGGTGLSPRDVTPEAMASVADRLVPGFGERMRSVSQLLTPRGFLSRSLAVIRGTTLMIAFPGSERGARQCFEAVVPALRHGVEILKGWDSECGGGHRHG
jgi:molybdenum cofactor synthesis domain-containing protein